MTLGDVQPNRIQRLIDGRGCMLGYQCFPSSGELKGSVLVVPASLIPPVTSNLRAKAKSGLTAQPVKGIFRPQDPIRVKRNWSGRVLCPCGQVHGAGGEPVLLGPMVCDHCQQQLEIYTW